MPSFYSLDDVIDINEKRLSEYKSAYEKRIQGFNNVIIIYSAIAIFLPQIITDLIKAKSFSFYEGFFILFTSAFTYSLVFTIKLLVPREVAFLIPPKDTTIG